MGRALTVALMLLGLGCAAATCAQAASAVRISQIYGGGGSSFPTVTYQRDYVELFNASAAAVDISGWTIEYGSPTGSWGSFSNLIFTFPSGTIMQPCRYLLIAMPPTNSAGTPFAGAPLPVTPDFDGVAYPTPSGPQLNMGNANGKVALFTAANTSVPCGMELPGTLVDKVAYGSSNCAEGTALGSLSITSGAVRNNGGFADTNDNAADFTVTSPPVPHNSASTSPCDLSAPGQVLATAQCAAISIGWNPVPNATGYRVRRDGIVISGVDLVAAPPFVDNSSGAVQHCYEVCAVSFAGDGPYSSTSCATAADAAPTINAQPTAVYSTQGGSDGFSVLATGVGLAYTWRKDGTPIPGAPNARYIVLNNLQQADAGSYDVVVCNSCGCVTSAAATLQVCALAQASVPSVVRAAAGDAFATIQAIATPGAVPQYWTRGKEPLTSGPKYSGVNTFTLTISNPTSADAGAYQLLYTGSCGGNFTSNVCKIDLSECTPFVTIATQPSDQTVSLGSQASFSVSVTGCDIPSYRWQRDSGRSWADVPGATSSTYAIASVTSSDFGSYRCVVTAPNGSSAISNPANLNLFAPRLLTWISKPLGCGLALVTWTSNVPMTAVVSYGPDCKTLINTTPASPLGFSGSVVLDLAGSAYAVYRIDASTPQNETAGSWCATAYFNSLAGNLGVEIWNEPYYGDLYGTQDGIPARIRLWNSGCVPIAGPITLTDLRINNVPPRRSDHSIDLPRDLALAPLAVGEYRYVYGIMFSRSEVGLPSKSGMTIYGTVQYGSPPHVVSVAGKFTLP